MEKQTIVVKVGTSSLTLSGFVIRRNAIETGVNVLTSLDTATALVTSLENTDVKKLTLIDIATIDKR